MENKENQQIKDKLEALRQKLRERYPDQVFESDEDYSSRISDDYDDFDRQISEYKGREQQLSDLYTKDPMAAKFIQAWMSDGDPRVQLLRAYGREGIEAAFNDPKVMEAMEKADKEFLEQVAHEKDLKEQWEKNRVESFANMEKIREENGYTDEQMDEAMAFLRELAQQIVMNNFTEKAFKSAMHALNYDRDIADAERVAEVRGRNGKIEERLRKPHGDGMPQLGGGSASPRESGYTLPGALGREKKSIYDLGGMKRIPRKGQ